MPSLDAIHWDVQAALQRLEASPSEVVPSACFILQALSAYVPEGARETVLEVINRALALVQGHIDQNAGSIGEMLLAKSELLTALVEYSIDAAQDKNLLNETDRTKTIDEINSALRQAVVTLRHARRANPQGFPQRVPDACFDCVHQKIRHQNLLFRSVPEMTTDADIPRLVDKWQNLTQTYREKLRDGFNANVSLGNTIDLLISLNRRAELSPNLRLKLKDLATELSVNLKTAPLPDSIRHRKLAKLLIEAFCLLEDPATAKMWLRAGITSLDRDIQNPSLNHDSEYLYQDADDWVGWALALDSPAPMNTPPPGPLLRETYPIVRGNDYPDIIPVSGIAILRAHITRPYSLIVCETPGSMQFAKLPSSHHVMAATELLFKAAGEDINFYWANKREPLNEGSWPEALDNCTKSLGFFDLRDKVIAEIPEPTVLIETGGAGLHLPWAAFLLSAGWDPRSVLVRSIHEENRTAADLAENGIRPLFLCCFRKEEVLHNYCRRLSKSIDAHFVHCDTVQGFQEQLNWQPRSLIVIGCHGVQRQITQELMLTIGDKIVRAGVLWKQIRLPAASAVMFITCYGGGGLSLATGKFGSQAELALDAGARLTIASRWPAWMSGDSEKTYRDLLLDIRSPDVTVWEAGAKVMSFMNGLKSFGIRYWGGWSAYTSRFWL